MLVGDFYHHPQVRPAKSTKQIPAPQLLAVEPHDDMTVDDRFGHWSFGPVVISSSVPIRAAIPNNDPAAALAGPTEPPFEGRVVQIMIIDFDRQSLVGGIC